MGHQPILSLIVSFTTVYDSEAWTGRGGGCKEELMCMKGWRYTRPPLTTEVAPGRVSIILLVVFLSCLSKSTEANLQNPAFINDIA